MNEISSSSMKSIFNSLSNLFEIVGNDNKRLTIISRKEIN